MRVTYCCIGVDTMSKPHNIRAGDSATHITTSFTAGKDRDLYLWWRGDKGDQAQALVQAFEHLECMYPKKILNGRILLKWMGNCDVDQS